MRILVGKKVKDLMGGGEEDSIGEEGPTILPGYDLWSHLFGGQGREVTLVTEIPVVHFVEGTYLL